MSKVTGMLSEAGKVFEIMLGIGLFGILFMVVFGNLSNNLGFKNDSTTLFVINESDIVNSVHANVTGYTLAEVNSTNANYQLTEVFNNSAGEYNNTITLGNFSLDAEGVLTNVTTPGYDNISISYSYAHSFESENIKNTNAVITNLTGGARTFFSFSGVWFTLLAVTILIVIILSVIGFVKRKDEKGGFSG